MSLKKNASGTGRATERTGGKTIPFQYLLIAAIVFVSDFLTKYLIRLQGIKTEGLIAITPVTNKGSLFSLFSNYGSINIIFIIVSIIAITLITILLKNDTGLKSQKTIVIGMGLIIGGVLGNLLDRILYGAVFDWINLHFWPVFNVADSGIVVGVILSIITLLPKSKRQADRTKRSAQRSS